MREDDKNAQVLHSGRLGAPMPSLVAAFSQRANAQRNWLDQIITRFADRIHPVDAAIATRAGTLLPSLTSLSRHRFHDALLVATAQMHGHGLITRRDTTFGPWTQTPIAIV
jgi:predicted nucleic acid-binding protein